VGAAAPGHPDDQGEAKANLFKVSGGYLMPVVFGGPAANSSVTLRSIPEIVAGTNPNARSSIREKISGRSAHFAKGSQPSLSR